MVTVYNAGRSLMLLGKLDESLRALSTAASYFFGKAQRDERAHASSGEAWSIYFRVLNDIGEIHLRHNNVDQAEQNFRAAFEGQKRFLDELHPILFTIRLNMGRVCVARSLFGAANKIFEYIIASYTEWWGRHYSETMRADAELAERHQRYGQMKVLIGDEGERET